MAEHNIKLSDLKKSDIKLKRREELSDDELDKVTGGYWEYQGYANGYWIECPYCGRYGESDFYSYMDASQQVDVFTCKCHGKFAVDINGNCYLK